MKTIETPGRTCRYLAAATALLLLASGFTAPQADEVRIYVTDSDSWSTSGGFAGGEDIVFGGTSGGARPQTAEIIKTINERCPEFTVTMKKDRADFILMLDHEGGKSFFRKDNKVVVFDNDGDAIYSGSTASLGNAVKDACEAIRADRNP